MKKRAFVLGVLVFIVGLTVPLSAPAYIGGPPLSLGMMCHWSTHVMIARVDRLDRDKGIVVFRKVQDDAHPEFNRFDVLPRLLPVYSEILRQLAALGPVGRVKARHPAFDHARTDTGGRRSGAAVLPGACPAWETQPNNRRLTRGTRISGSERCPDVNSSRRPQASPD